MAQETRRSKDSAEHCSELSCRNISAAIRGGASSVAIRHLCYPLFTLARAVLLQLLWSARTGVAWIRHRTTLL